MVVLKRRTYWSIVERCQCKAKLEIEQEDIYVTYLDREFNYTFKCPCCNIESNIDEKLLPKYIKISALEELKKRLGITKGVC